MVLSHASKCMHHISSDAKQNKQQVSLTCTWCDGINIQCTALA